MSKNPYAPPETSSDQTESPAESTRRLHINTEATIKSLGTIYIVGGILLVLSSLRLLSNFQTSGNSVEDSGFIIGATIPPLILIFLGFRIRKLKKIAVIIGGLLQIITLFAVPVGTLIGSLIIWTVFNKKGRYVVTPEYKEIIAETPHIKYRTSIITWILLAILILLLIGIAVMVFKNQA